MGSCPLAPEVSVRGCDSSSLYSNNVIGGQVLELQAEFGEILRGMWPQPERMLLAAVQVISAELLISWKQLLSHDAGRLQHILLLYYLCLSLG